MSDRCSACGHDHSVRSQEPDELTPFRPGHSDYCDCDCLVEMLRQVGAAYDLRHGNGPDGDGSQEMWDER